MDFEFDIQALKAGDAAEFKKVYDHFSPRLNGYFYSKSFPEILCADVIQQTFIKLWERRQGLNPQLKLSTQIFQFAKTTMIDEVRKYKTARRKSQALYETSQYKRENVEFFPFEDEELQQKLSRAIDALPPVRKKVFLLSREENMSQKEISSQLAISIKTVNKHMQLAMRQLKTILNLLVLMFLFLM